ncbi:MAG: hypothetical protein N2D54_08715, partial [Chloroflexota bacterium]
GFYQDDWYLLWSVKARGVESIIPLFSIDRPIMGYINYFDYLILGDNVILWQLYALLWRVLLGLGVLWLLRLIWPNRQYATTAMALLVVVYPGFLSQPVAMNYKNYIFEFAVAIYSIVAMLFALRAETRAKQIIYWGISLFLSLLYVLLYEFMIGLEGFRLALLVYLYLQQYPMDKRHVLKQTFLKYSPYLVMMVGFVFWRFFVFESERASTSETAVLAQYLSAPLSSGIRLVFELGKDILETVIFSWVVPAYQLMASSRYGVFGPAMVLAGLAGLAVLGYSKLSIEKGQDDNQKHTQEYFWLGLIGVVTALATVVIPGREVRFNGFERYSLHASLGVAILLWALISGLKENFRTGILVLLVGISVATHYHNANLWRERWALHSDSWWQLTWRAPGIKEDTVLIVQLPSGLGFEQDYEIWGPVNMIYHPNQDPPALNAQVMLRDTTYLIQRGFTETDHLRDIDLSRDYDNVLIMSRPTPQSCLHVIDGNLPFLSQFEEARIEKVARYSNISRVSVGDIILYPEENIFGPEPAQKWCYFYQRASLARQMNNWEEVARIGTLLIKADLRPVDRAEWMPFLEGFIIQGDAKNAKWLTTIIKGDKNLRFSICNDLEQAETFPDNYNYDEIYSLLCTKVAG